MDNYTIWTKHDKPGVLMEEDKEDDDKNNSDLAHLYEAGAFDDEPMDEAEENAVEELPYDELVKASRPLIRVLVINDNGLWINNSF
jgi:hypothetical protein